MIFAGRKSGTAKIGNLRAPLPVNAGVIPLSTEQAIGLAADRLAQAEGIQSDQQITHVSPWGVVAMAINPSSPYRRALRNAWKRQFKREQKFDHKKFGRGMVDAHGFLRVRLPWIHLALRHVDFCLATQTAPNGSLPNAKAIADAARPFGKNSYFARTVGAGIVTADDDAVQRYLDEPPRE